jgi:predicted HTH domain antitoxin
MTEPLDGTLALHLFATGQVTLSQGAGLAGLSLEAFIERLGETGITAVDYPPEELADEVKAAR